MNKLLLTVFLLCSFFTTNAIAEPYMSDSAKQKYLDWVNENLDKYDDTSYITLAISPSGCWSAGWGGVLGPARSNAVKKCKKFCKVPSCDVVDVNGTSDFIKRRSSSISPSTSATSSNSSTSVTGSSTVFMSDQDKTKYLSWVKKLSQGDAEGKCWGGECRAALAVGPNGCWAKFPDMSLSRSKNQALKKCNTDCSTNDCQIMDIDGKSAFIKQKGSSVSSSTSISSSSFSTSSSSNEIWCATKRSVSRVSKYSCDLYDGKSFDTQSQAKTEHKRLNSASSTASGSNYDPAVELEYWKLVRDSNDIDLLQDYLEEYPNGKFAPLARLKIKKLKSD